MIVVACPFCEEEDKATGSGCCYCDHSGRIKIGPGQEYETIDDWNDWKKVYDDYRKQQREKAIETIKQLRSSA